MRAGLQSELRSRRQARLEERTRGLPLLHRLDPVFVTLLVAAALILVLFASAGVLVAGWLGWLEPPLVRPMPDERLLTNVRANLRERPLLAATLHEGDLYLSQQGGALHRYDPRTELWTTSLPLDAGNSDLIALRSGCVPRSRGRDTNDCSELGLWGLSAEAGLLRGDGNRWDVVLGESAFEGPDGAKPSSAELTTAAVSAGSRWLLLGTRSQGVGLYDQEGRRWVSLTPAVQATLSTREVTHLQWWRGRFWIGGPGGLTYLIPGPEGEDLAPDATTVELEGGVVEEIPGRILDLDAGTDLWVLEERPCLNSSPLRCLRLSRRSHPQSPFEADLDETRRYPELDLESLRFAHQEGEVLALAGATGLHTYEADRRRWNQHLDRPVLTTWTNPRGGFYAGYDGGAVSFAQGQIVERWPLEGERVRRLLVAAIGSGPLRGPTDEVLALSADGNVWSLRSARQPLAVSRSSRTSLDPQRFSRAVELGDKVLFFGPQGVMVHDVSAGSYLDIPRAQLAPWLLDPQTPLYSSDENLFALLPASKGPIAVRVTDRQALGRKAFDEAGELPFPVQNVTPGSGELGVIAGEGSAFRVTRSAVQELTGRPAYDLERLDWRDVRVERERLLVATDRGLRTYDLAERDWRSFRLEGLALRELASQGGRLRILTAGGQLAGLEEDDPTLIGEVEPWPISPRGLSDARLDRDRHLYLAGDGGVARYDLARRRITKTWNLPGATGEVRLFPPVGSGEETQPVSVAGEKIFLGARQLDPGAGPVVGLSQGKELLWTVRRLGSEDRRRYLKGYARSAPFSSVETRCFFRHPIGGTGHLLDVRKLGSGWLAVATTRGLKLYSQRSRSWYAVSQGGPESPNPLPVARSLHVVGHQLALWSGGSGDGGRLMLLDLEDLTRPGSCAPEAVVSVDPVLDVEARAASFRAAEDAAVSSAAWIATDGSVSQWRSGERTQLLAPAGRPPETRELRHLYQFGERLFFATGSSIHIYRLDDHSWSRHPVVVAPMAGQAPEPILDLNLEEMGDSLTLTATTASGAIYVGAFDPPGPVRLDRVLTPRSLRPGRFGAAGEDLLDVHSRLGKWGFVLRDRLRVYDPEARRWQTDLQFPGPPDATVSLRRSLGRDVVVKAGGREWWIEQDASIGSQRSRLARFVPQGAAATAMDARGAVWRLEPDGSVEECRAAGAEYECRQVAAPGWHLEPSTVREAYVHEGLILMVGPDGTRAYDQELGRDVSRSLPGEVSRLTGVAQARWSIGGELWIRGDKGELLRLAGDGSWTTFPELKTGVLAIPDQGYPWIRLASGPSRRWSGSFVDPMASTPDLRLLPILDGQPVTAVGSQGLLYRYQSDTFVPLGRIPSSLEASTVDALLYFEDAGGWWLKRGRSLFLLENGPRPGSERGELRVRQRLQLPWIVPRILATEASVPGRFRLQLTGGEVIGIEYGSSASTLEELTATSMAPVAPAHLVPDRWPELSMLVVPRPDGKLAFDPVTRLAVASTPAGDDRGPDIGAGLVARRLSGDRLLTRSRIQFEPEVPPALDVGWLVWERRAHEPMFRVSTPSGPQTFTRHDFIRGGRLPFEDVRAVVARAPDRLDAATPSGVWTFPSRSLRLDQPGVTFAPATLEGEIRGLHGRFLTPGQSLLLDPGLGTPSFENGTYGEHVITVGSSIVLREDTRAGRVSGTIESSGASLPVFDSSGLGWDRRRGIAHQALGRLTLHTGAGLHSLHVDRNWSQFDLGPSGAAHETGTLRSSERGTVYFHDGRRWHQRRSGTWIPAQASDLSDGVRLDDDLWSWKKVGDRVEVRLKGIARGLTVGGDGQLGFASDRLQAATAHGQRLFVLSDAFLEIASDPDSLAEGTVRRHPGHTAHRLESVAREQGSTPVLYLWRDSAISRWDESARTFRPLPRGSDPLSNRELVRTDRLRFRRAAGRVTQELRVDELPGSPGGWKKFSVSPRGFPFDQVQAIESSTAGLLVHTPAGLQIYSPRGAVGWADMEAIYDLGSGEVRLGRPATEPQRLVILSRQRCHEWLDNRSLVPCVEPTSLEERWRGETDLWRFTKRRSRVRGSYRNIDGEPTSTEVRLERGHLPHDHLRQVLACGETFASLWRNGWATVSKMGSDTPGGTPRPAHSLTAAQHTDRLGGRRIERLLCLARAKPLDVGQLQAGLYAATGENRFWYWTAGRWSSVGEGEAQLTLAQKLSDGPIFDRRRLRLRDRPGFQFEQRSSTGAWIPIPWTTEGRIATDAIRDLQAAHGVLWAVTDAGLTSLTRDTRGNVRLDGDTLTVVREPTADGRPCPITDFRIDGGGAWVRCNASSGQVFRGELVLGQDRGVFQPLRGRDPFTEQSLVSERDTGYWDWRLLGRMGGKPGSLALRLRGESASLLNGRFDFDDLTSVALHHPGVIDLASAASGWYRQPRVSLRVATLKRPDRSWGVPQGSVSRIAVTRQEDDRLLCLETRPGEAFLLSSTEPRGRAQECPEDLGRDGVWSYSQLDTQLRIRAPGRASGLAQRELRQGRFTDHMAGGLPIAASDEAGLHYLVPTEAGVVRLDREASPVGIYAPPAPLDDAEDGPRPMALYLDLERGPVYLTRRGVFTLDGDQEVAPEIPLPQGARITDVEAAPPDFLRLGWRTQRGPGWTLLQSGSYAPLAHNSLLVNAAEWHRFIRGRLGWGDPSPWIELRLLAGSLGLRESGGSRFFRQPWPRPLRPLAVEVRGRSLFLIEPRRLSEMRLDVAVERLFTKPTKLVENSPP